MTVEALLDTNVLIYAVDRAANNLQKRVVARQLIARGTFGVSAQVLQEFYVNVTRKIAKPLAPQTAMRWIDVLARRPMVDLDAMLIKKAIAISVRHRISYWDGAIVAAAEALGAKTLFTEDLAHERRYGSVQAINPFIGL